jgi:hypothetical protein
MSLGEEEAAVQERDLVATTTWWARIDPSAVSMTYGSRPCTSVARVCSKDVASVIGDVPRESHDISEWVELCLVADAKGRADVERQVGARGQLCLDADPASGACFLLQRFQALVRLGVDVVVGSSKSQSIPSSDTSRSICAIAVWLDCA